MIDTFAPTPEGLARRVCRMLTEPHKFSAEQLKLAGEATKLAAETDHLERVIPWQTLILAIGTSVAAVILLLRLTEG